MIICHPLKLIFVKTYKTSGTSFEHVLRQYCSKRCITSDETFFPSQNSVVFSEKELKYYRFVQHTSSKKAKHIIENVLKKNWYKQYKKICIHRNPYEVLISMYYDAITFKKDSGFWPDKIYPPENWEEYLTNSLNNVTWNIKKAPIEDMNFIIRYEYFEQDIDKLNIPNFWKNYSITRIKDTVRPKTATLYSMYKDYPDIVKNIAEICKEEIEYFNYKIPLYN